MATSLTLNIFSLISLFLLLPLLASCVEKQSYIVYFGGHEGAKTVQEIEDHHLSHLISVKNDEADARASLIYSYKHSINGFAAMLTPEEASKFSEMEEVATVIKSDPYQYSLQTTRSWSFVGIGDEGSRSYNDFTSGKEFLKRANYGKGIIVGLIDSGVWPESQSFRDKGMGPIPKRWKGSCQTGPLFNSSNCSKKIIGAKYFVGGYKNHFGHVNASEDCLSPRDLNGHGTHTASIVAGRRVRDAADFYGYGKGTATGGAPLAHVAIYKACWAIPNQSKALGNVCFPEDLLAAIDEAAADGVDVLSISIGMSKQTSFDQDAIAIGTLHAVKKNIVVACAAGNNGPAPASLSNTAPWVITVAASSIDRKFPGSVLLGNRHSVSGETVTPFKMDEPAPLVYAGDVGLPHVPTDDIVQCFPGSLDPKKVKGKVVLCLKGGNASPIKGSEVKRAGGVGIIVGNWKNDGDRLIVSSHFLPATDVVFSDTQKIFNYIKGADSPTAMIGAATTVFDYQPAPYMAPFSSRGPNVVDPCILKPDITAPGLNILAAWSGGISPSKEATDNRVVNYNFDSGTSMATPHVAAAAALLRATHPKWSNAAIRSALMTTAWTRDNEKEFIKDVTGAFADPFQIGSGHLLPIQAANPGLIYDASYEDYLLYLCSNGINNLDRSFKCPQMPLSPINLNYPSISITQFIGYAAVTRTVTNVGNNRYSKYTFEADAPFGITVQAVPDSLEFNEFSGQTQTFSIIVAGYPALLNNTDHFFAWYAWVDKQNNYLVKSPIAVNLSPLI